MVEAFADPLNVTRTPVTAFPRYVTCPEIVLVAELVDAAAWVAVKVWSAIVIVPNRPLVPVFASIENETEPGPVPDVVPVKWIQSPFFVALQLVPGGADT